MNREAVGVTYRALGSIEGRIELISIRKGSRLFSITQESTLRTIICSLPEDIEATAIEAMRDRRRVVATGLVAYNASDEPITLEIRKELRFLGRPDDLPSGNTLAGSDPEITDYNTRE